MSQLRLIVDRMHEAFNDRDFTAFADVFDDHVEMTVDGASFHGLTAVTDYAASVVREFPGVRMEFERVVVEAGDSIVTEMRMVNDSAGASGDASWGGWRLQGMACEIYRIVGGRIVECRTYLAANVPGEDPGAATPPRTEVARTVAEVTALRRVATLVARGTSESEVFTAVVAEALVLVDEDFTALLRYEPDGGTIVVAMAGDRGGFTVGHRDDANGDGVAQRVRTTGRPARLDSYAAATGAGAAAAVRAGITAGVGAPIVVDGRLWGVLMAVTRGQPSRAGTEIRLAHFADLVAVAIGNAESRAELISSRARIVASGDEARRRLQRDVHDGAQQRLVHAVIALKLAHAELGEGGSRPAELVSDALGHAERATAALRELARGILPAALTHRGLSAGIDSLISHIDLAVRVDVLAERLPATVETTAYFIVAESLTNVVKHSGASHAHVRAHANDGQVHLEVRDNGRGGAELGRGSGLIGLTDRVAAVGGTISIVSPQSGGTTLSVVLPIASQPLDESA